MAVVENGTVSYNNSLNRTEDSLLQNDVVVPDQSNSIHSTTNGNGTDNGASTFRQHDQHLLQIQQHLSKASNRNSGHHVNGNGSAGGPAESAIAALNCSGAVLGSLPIRVSPSKTPVHRRAPRTAIHRDICAFLLN